MGIHASRYDIEKLAFSPSPTSFLDFAQPLGLQDNTIQQPAGPRFLSTIKKKNQFQNLQALVLEDDRA